jgi:hypothetical protein
MNELINLHAEFHLLTSNDSLVIATELQPKRKLRMAAMLLFLSSRKMSIFFEDLST